MKRATLEEVEIFIHRTSAHIQQGMPRGWGFILIAASCNEDEAEEMATFASNIEKGDTVEILEELAQRVRTGEIGEDL